jgi:hypothetical protein
VKAITLEPKKPGTARLEDVPEPGGVRALGDIEVVIRCAEP